ncbi:MAG: hypothetical protein WC792_00075 [Candidatus Micrarchaeia archaeon]|jgi:uncharacterized protein (UPF0333 family)
MPKRSHSNLQPRNFPLLFSAIRAQSSVELLVLFAIGIAALAIIVTSSQTALLSSEDAVRFSQAKSAASSLAQAADEVYSEGPGAKKQVYITVPAGTVSASVQNTSINLRVRIGGGFSDANAQTSETVIGNIPTDPGTYRLWVVATEDGRVSIGTIALSVQPGIIYSTLYPSNFTQQNLTVTNLNNTASLSVTLNLSRPTSTDVSVNWSDTTGTLQNIVLGAGASSTLTLNISSATGTTGSFLDGFIYSNASNLETVQTDIAITVSSTTCGTQSCTTLSCYTLPYCSSYCTGSLCPPSCGTGSCTGGGNVSYITIETFSDSPLATPKQIFDFALQNISITGSSWNSSLNVTVDVRFPNASSIGPPYPKDAAPNGAGTFTDSVSPAGLPSGNNYTVRANQSGIARLYSFNVTGCS